ncbi:MAG TPA: AI-2E family transporter [Geminicoccus sp.]|jgi:predicted PurR-regulated permease PerM|uniref:AI-2E family transporter n=1 Tax=Geminicoccus sp. TaxID=2024832 RepID=UPI002E36C8E1|nr:AI-2E family transporter [Geminicoccus sp.]HEX2526003.1 AI-2E family transporter [Geminicoccus sp.]
MMQAGGRASGEAARPASDTARAIWWMIGIILAIGIVYLIHDALLLLFAGILLAVLFRGLTRRLAAWTGMPDPAALAVVVLSLAVLLFGGIWLLAPQVTQQVEDLTQQVPAAWGNLKGRVVERLPDEGPLADAPQQLSDVGSSRIFQLMGSGFGVITGTLGALGSGLVMIVVGIYLAVDPPLYRRGLVRLLPMRHRPRSREVLELIGEKLEGWILGTMISAAIVGCLTWLGLWLLGIPIALVLALIATVLTFIPNIGPLMSLVPAVLIAASEGLGTTLAVVALYMGVQAVESYLITPVIQQRTVDLPPVVILLAQIVMGILFGMLGVALAMPLAAAAMVLVQELWVKDRLERPAASAA